MLHMQCNAKDIAVNVTLDNAIFVSSMYRLCTAVVTGLPLTVAGRQHEKGGEEAAQHQSLLSAGGSIA